MPGMSGNMPAMLQLPVKVEAWGVIYTTRFIRFVLGAETLNTRDPLYNTGLDSLRFQMSYLIPIVIGLIVIPW